MRLLNGDFFGNLSLKQNSMLRCRMISFFRPKFYKFDKLSMTINACRLNRHLIIRISRYYQIYLDITRSNISAGIHRMSSRHCLVDNVYSLALAAQQQVESTEENQMFGTQIFESLTVKHVSRQIIQRVARDQKSFANDNLNDIVKFNKLKISILKKFDKTFCSFLALLSFST